MSRNRIFSFCVILFGLFMIWQTTQIQTMFVVATEDTGPKLFPMMASIALVVCGIGNFLASRNDEEPYLTPEGWKKLGVVIALFIGYVLGLKYLGFLISTPVACFSLVYIMSGRKAAIIRASVFSIALTALLYFFFNNIMSILLPKGSLF